MTTQLSPLLSKIAVASVSSDDVTTSTTPFYPIYAAYPPYPTDGEMSQPSGVHVRAEEIGLVLLALILWAGAGNSSHLHIIHVNIRVDISI